MADADYQAWVEVLPDFSNFNNKATRGLVSGLGAAGTAGGLAAGRNLQPGILGGIKGMGGALLGAVAALGIGQLIGNAIGEGIRYSLDSIGLASDLNEAFNANNVTFGADIAAQLKELGGSAPQRLALTRNAFAGFATQFSAFAKTIRGNDVVGFLDELTTRGADFASVYNLDVKDALQLFQSGLAGETEPLRRYGLDLSAASVEAYAYASGIAQVGEDLTEAQKQQARYGSLLEQTSLTQGDATNTAGELAGQQRRLNVQLEEAQTALGQHLLPGFLTLVTFANTTLLPKLGEITEKVGPLLGQALIDVGPRFEELADKVAPLIADFVTATAEEGIPKFIDLMDDIAEAAPGWGEAFKFGMNPDEGPASFLNGVEGALEGAGLATRDFLFGSGRDERVRGNDLFWQDFVAAFQGYKGALEQKSEELKTYWGDSLRGLKTLTLQFSLNSEGHAFAQGFADGITTNSEAAVTAAENMALAARNKVRNTMLIASPSRVMRELGGYVSEGFALGITDGIAGVDSAMRSLVSVPSVTSGVSLAGANSSGGLPGTVTLVDRDGSLLGHMAVAVDRYDTAAAATTRGGRI